MSSNEKSIIFLIGSLRGGGAERVCVTLANMLSEKGWRVNVVVLNLDNAVMHRDLNKEIDVVDLDVKHARTSMFKLLKVLKKKKIEKILVFNHQLAVLLVVMRAIFGLSIKVIARNINTLSRLNESQHSFWHRHISSFFVKKLFRNADKIIAQSEGMGQDLIRNFDIPDSKITVINNPINPRVEEASRDVVSRKAEKKEYLLCVGRLDSSKAFHYAIEAFGAIASCYPSISLKIIGQGNEKDKLKELAGKLGINDRVFFEGYKNNIIPYYLNAKATVLTSEFEGFPNVLLESIALGTPIISFDCESGPREIVENYTNGILVPFQDKLALQEAMEFMLLNEGYFDESSVIESASRFSLEVIIKQYESILNI